MTERLGIVYTPVEVVDFIIHSVEDVLREEFGTSITEKNVHVLDPFAGTGTFISRLLQSGLIDKQSLKRKFESEIHANEIVLLAYYIASINAESVYQDLTDDHQYRPFNGIVLTDTFQLYEEDRDMIANLMPDNSQRRKNQRKRKINVIIGNPPYSAGQTSANDNAANVKYKNLDRRIEGTYSVSSSATNKNALYDSYIRAFRMASDRIGEEGVIGFVTGAGWIDGNATDGMRKCLVEEFDKIYVFNLRGNQRTSGELSRREGGKIFGSGSRTPIAITILVRKRGTSPRQGEIFYCDVGDYFDREEKLRIISHYQSINGISREQKWSKLTPDSSNDWLNKTNESFSRFVALGDKSSKMAHSIVTTYSAGLKSGRDAWCYNFSRNNLEENITKMVSAYNQEVMLKASNPSSTPSLDPKYVSWNRGLLNDYQKLKKHKFDPARIYTCIYRPFTKMYVYFDRSLNDMTYQWYKLSPNPDSKNKFIAVTGIGAKSFSALGSTNIVDLQVLFNSQVFPLNEYYINEESDLFSTEKHTYRSAIKTTSESTHLFQEKYEDEVIFYLIYAILHHPQYTERFANDLLKSLPRIPTNFSSELILELSKKGEILFKLHADFDAVDKYPVEILHHDRRENVISDLSIYRVEKMRFAGSRGREDKTSVNYNQYITIKNIPLEAYEYVVNGKPALEWVMERQCVKIDKDSGIVNDANDFAIETMNNPAYPLELFQRVITVSLETMKIVKSLPPLD